MRERSQPHIDKRHGVQLYVLLSFAGALFILVISPLHANSQLAPSIEAKSSAVDEEALARLLYQDCGSCHGLRLTGGLGPDITPTRMAAMPRDWIAQTITEGRPGTAMPPWGPLLSRAEIEWLVTTLQMGHTQ